MTRYAFGVAVVCGFAMVSGCATVDTAVAGAGKAADAVKSAFKKDGEPSLPTIAQSGSATSADKRAGQAKPVDRQQDLKSSPRATDLTTAVDHQCAVQQSTFSILDSFKERATAELVVRVSNALARAGAERPISQQDQAALREYSRTVIWIPGELESLLGDFRYKDLQKSGAILAQEEEDTLKAGEQAFASLRSAVGSGLPFPLRLAVVSEGTSQAVSIPGGYVVINQTWLLSASKRQAATLMMAHEIAHIMKRHETKEFQVQVLNTRAGFRLFKSIFEAARGRVVAGGAASNLQGVFGGLFETFKLTNTVSELWTEMRNVQLRYQQDQEIEADACAVRLLGDAQVKLDAWEAWKVYRQFAYQSANSAEATTHPTTAAREAKLECMTRTEAKTLPRCASASKAGASVPAMPKTPTKPVVERPANKPPQTPR